MLITSSCTTNKSALVPTGESDFNLDESLTTEGYNKIEMSKLPSGHLCLNITLNGINGNFILDTGSGATVVEEKSKEKFSLITENTFEKAAGAGGTNLEMQYSLGNKMLLGEFEIDSLDLVVMNLDHINHAFTSLGIEEVDGVLGSDVLATYHALIDYSNLFLYLK